MTCTNVSSPLAPTWALSPLLCCDRQSLPKYPCPNPQRCECVTLDGQMFFIDVIKNVKDLEVGRMFWII